MNDDIPDIRTLRRDRPTRTPARLALELLVMPILWALPFAAFFGTLNSEGARAYQLAFFASLFFSYCIRWALLAVESFVVPRLHRTLWNDPQAWIAIGAAYIAAAVLASYLAAFLIDTFLWSTFLEGPRSFIVVSFYTLTFTTLFGGIAYARAFYRHAVERSAQVERIRGELARAELRALRAQVNPHFLFNTLNTIAALIHEDPRDAEEVVTRLAEVFRYALTSAQREHSRFSDELEFLRSYLEIERVRLGERLVLEEHIEPGLGAILVPSLLFQPLVENAVRYAVAARAEGGRITLSAARVGDSLLVTVADDGPGFEPGATPQGHGVGLESVRERVRWAGAGHHFEIRSASGQGTVAVVTLPLDPSSSTPSTPSPTPSKEPSC